MSTIQNFIALRTASVSISSDVDRTLDLDDVTTMWNCLLYELLAGNCCRVFILPALGIHKSMPTGKIHECSTEHNLAVCDTSVATVIWAGVITAFQRPRTRFDTSHCIVEYN